MNDRLFPVPYGLLAGLSPATSLHWAAMMNASHALLGGMCPMVAPNYAATRSALAKSTGLGRKAAAPLHPLRQSKTDCSCGGRDDDCGVNQVTPEESPQGTCQSLTGCI